MSKRFGRNQKRQMREALAVQAMQARQATNALHHETEARHRMRRELEAQLDAARRAKDVVRITVDALFGDREAEVAVRAQFEMSRREPLYAAINLDRRDIVSRSDDERAAFIKHAGELIAEHALGQIIRHWRRA